METVFTKIRDGIIPARFLYRDQYCFVILDHNPVAKGHCLVICNEPIATLDGVDDKVINHMMGVVKLVDAKLRQALGCDATNILINNGKESGQEVPHLHIHVIPRFKDDNKGFGISHSPYEGTQVDDYQKMLSL